MFSQFSTLSIPKFGFGRSTQTGKIDIPPVPVYNVETDQEKRGRTLKHLLKLNHTNFSILYNHEKFHNHTPHILGSAYILGSTADQLTSIYEDVTVQDDLEPWVDSPSEIALHDYRDFLGQRNYQRAWVDFFEDQLVWSGDYEWKNVVNKFLFEEGSKNRPNPIPMVHSMVSGLGHGLIHLGYAYELDSREIAMEAMGLIATCYDPKLATFLNKSIGKITANTGNPITYSTSNVFEVMARVNGDKRLDGLFEHEGGANLNEIMENERIMSIVAEHWAAWKVTDPKKQFQDSQKLAVSMLLSTAKSWGGHGYDFFLVHLLTTSHAIRIILPHTEPKYHLLIVREWLLISILIYIAQLRPVIDSKKIANIDIGEKGWTYCVDLAKNGKHAHDAHYVKALRAIKEAAAVWGDDESWFIRAAVKFADEFSEWEGFGPHEKEGN